MHKILVFTKDLDFYSEQLLLGLSQRGYEILCVVDPQQLEKFPKWKSNLRVIAEVPLHGRFDKKAANQYAEIIKSNRPDICLCYTSRALSIALKAKRQANLATPIIGTRGAVGGISCWYLQDWFTYFNPSLDAVICMSDAIRNRLENQARYFWRSHPGRFLTIYQGYSSLVPTATKRDHNHRATANTRIIATIANERPIKGMGYLLDALEYHLQFQDWKLMWIGEVSDATKKRIALSAKLKDRVLCLGYRKDARELLAQADLYVQPTIAPGEGIGNAIAEAMSAELAVVTSNVGGALELVSKVSPELLFEPANPRSLARTLDKFLTDDAMCEQLGRAGADVLIKNFSLTAEIDKHINLFEELT
jgi:glycosyltransferase involved in cell wall biosynthesis